MDDAMQLVGFGDSFVEGLIKLPKLNSGAERKEINFITQLAKLSPRFNSCINYGHRGAGNTEIAYNVYKFIRDCDYTNSFLLIALSCPSRAGVYSINDDTYTNIMIPEYEHEPTFEVDTKVLFLQTLLSSLNIPFAMINSFANHIMNPDSILTSDMISNNWINKNYSHNTLFNIITGDYKKHNISALPKQHTNHTDFSMVQPSKYVTECFHPTAEGHILIANTLMIELEQNWDTYTLKNKE